MPTLHPDRPAQQHHVYQSPIAPGLSVIVYRTRQCTRTDGHMSPQTEQARGTPPCRRTSARWSARRPATLARTSAEWRRRRRGRDGPAHPSASWFNSPFGPTRSTPWAFGWAKSCSASCCGSPRQPEAARLGHGRSFRQAVARRVEQDQIHRYSDTPWAFCCVPRPPSC
jgi:hypothetical protein